MSTLAGEILRKVSRKSSYFDKSPSEVILSMNLYPELWRTVPLIRVEKEVTSVWALPVNMQPPSIF
jgi:hypothetical protein